MLGLPQLSGNSSQGMMSTLFYACWACRPALQDHSGLPIIVLSLPGSSRRSTIRASLAAVKANYTIVDAVQSQAYGQGKVGDLPKGPRVTSA